MTNNIIEMVTYHLKAGVTKQDLESTLESVNVLLKVQPGFMYRSVSCDENDQWYDIVYWQDLETAKAAGEVFMASEEGKTLCSMIDMDNCFMRHMPITSECMNCESAA